MYSLNYFCNFLLEFHCSRKTLGLKQYAPNKILTFTKH